MLLASENTALRFLILRRLLTKAFTEAEIRGKNQEKCDAGD